MSGSSFQSVGAATEKVLAPQVFKLKCGIKRRFLDDERSARDGAFYLISDPTGNNMLNIRIVKGGCRGLEAVKFGVVGPQV